MNEIRMGTGVLAPQPIASISSTVPADSSHETALGVPVRRRLLAVASIVSPLALAAQYALDPTGMLPRDDAAGLLNAIAEHPAQYLAATVVYLVGMLTLVAWALTLFAALRDVTPRLVATGSTMLTVGAIGGAGFAGLRLAACSFVENGESSVGAAEIWTRLQEGPAFAVLGPLVLMAVIGTLVTAFAMIRARSVVAIWAGPLYVIGFVLASGEFPTAVSVVGGVVQVVAMLPVVRLALRSTR